MAALSAWERMQLIHSPKRPNALDYIHLVFEHYYEMHGDRLYGDDGAITTGIATFHKLPVTVIAQVRGKDIEQNKKANFAMAHPEGYRKALRMARQAEKFGRPVICLIDTPGAYCGIGAEERGQGEAIARNLMEFMRLKTPIISIVTGEGGSGGALALGVCDELAMLENAVYSVISPRGAANILWRDSGREKEAANLLRITAPELMELGICDKVIAEPPGGAQTDVNMTAEHMVDYLFEALKRICKKDLANLLQSRYNKFRKIGVFSEQEEKLQ